MTVQDIASEATEPEVLMTPGLETLSWCIDEIRRSFAEAISHLQGAVETGSDSATAARAARASAHQAGGALTIIDIPGPGLLVAEIEGLLQQHPAVKLAQGQTLLEASGGITIENVFAVAETGVDVISIGALTHSAPSLDVGLDVL